MNHLIHLLDNAPLGIYDAEKAGCPGGLTWQGKTIIKPNAGSWHCSSAVFWALCAIFKETKIEESISVDEIKRLQDWCWSGAKFRAGGPGGLVEMDLASWIVQGEELPKTPTLEALDIVQYIVFLDYFFCLEYPCGLFSWRSPITTPLRPLNSFA